MDEVVRAYIDYIFNLKEISKPAMPKISPDAYTDNEYVNAIVSVMDDFDKIDDIRLTLQFLKGETANSGDK